MAVIPWILLLIILIPLAAVILDSPVGRALARRVEKDSASSLPDARRIEILEAEVERLGREVTRLDEETAFLHRLLENRSPRQQSIPPGENTEE